MDALADHEREKYRRIWRCPEYWVRSPGEESADEAIEYFGVVGTLIDFGCGEGKALAKFRSAGFDSVGVDHVHLQPNVIGACLWALPDSLPVADFGFCADVMEHIPPERVDDVLRSIADKVRHSAYFRISTILDGMGNLIGERLHLTVRPGIWWHEVVARSFLTVQLVRETADHVVITARK